MTTKELRTIQNEYAAKNLREQQHNHLGKLRTYGYRLFTWG